MLIYYIIVWAVGVMWICAYWGERIHKLKNSPKYTTHHWNSISQTLEFGDFLKERGEDMDVKERSHNSSSYESTYRDIFLGESVAAFALVRKCHLQGCEIILRQMGEEDLSEDEKKKVIKEYRTGVFRKKPNREDNVYIYGSSKKQL